MRRQATGRHASPCRRFTLLDGMIAVAALGAGLGLIRPLNLDFDWEIYGEIWLNPHLFWDSWMADQAIVQAFNVATIITFASTLATLAFRLRSPKPSRRRLARQPGMAAILTAAAAWIACAPWIITWPSDPPEPTAYAVESETNLSIVVALAGFGVATRWGLLLLSRRWRAEASWIDRLGRLVGITWVVLSICAIGLRMVC